MNGVSEAELPRSAPHQNRLWLSGVIFSAAAFLAGLGNYAFQGLMGRLLVHVENGHTIDKEFGYMNTTLGFISLLSLPVLIASTAITHYIAHFRASGDEARLQGLVDGCKRLLLRLTIGGSLLAIVLVKPLSDFFNFPRGSLMLTALFCVLAGLWGGYATGLCQGLAWFKRLAAISLLAAALRLLFGWVAARHFAVAESAVAASGFAFLSNLVLLYWRRELRGSGHAISPWTKELGQYFFVGAATVGATYCFTYGDLPIAQRHFAATEIGTYSAAGVLGRALPMVVAPMLTVLFTSRSGHRTISALRAQLELLGLYAVGLSCGVMGLLFLRGFLVEMIFGKPSPEAAEMVGRFAVTMAFVGLLQAMGMWALASRWFRVALLYGTLGLTYWLVLLVFGTTPQRMLHLMPMSAGIAFVVLFVAWLSGMRAAGREGK
jgi:hypothetical protein